MGLLYYPKFWQEKFSYLSIILIPFSLIYTILAYLRYYCSKEYRLPAKVISIGNVTAGGTGKTQLAIFLAKELKSKGVSFVIISKGYGGNYKKQQIVTEDSDVVSVGDEALEMCKYGNVIVARKVVDAIPLLLQIKPDVVIVDDGIQNPSFYKDYRVITLDSRRLFGNFLPIPSGPIRMPYIMHKLDSIVMVGIAHNHHLKQNIMLKSDITYHARIESDLQIKSDSKRGYYAFSAIGDPERFFDLLRIEGFNLKITKVFPDHHFYSNQNISEMKEQASALGLTMITTTKDYVKLSAYGADDIIPYKVKLSLKDKEKFMHSIYEKLSIAY